MVLYFLLCRKNVRFNYKKYIRNTFAIPGAIVSAFIFLANHGLGGHFFPLLFVFWVFFYGLNSIFYFVNKTTQKNEPQPPVNIPSQREDEARRAEVAKLENDDMRKIKQLMADISQKVKALDAFNDELNVQMSKLRAMGDNTVAEVYGEVITGIKKENYLGSYSAIRQQYASSVDGVIAAQCDKIVGKISDTLESKRSAINSNLDAKHKYHSLQSDLQKQYDKEFKLQKIKAIGEKVNEFTDETADLEIALSSSSLLQSSMEKFNELNLEIETRRELELKYSTDSI